ncbi:hypothetical protein NKI79_30780 [Mesorhizobium sp. M0340]|uniref:hypothetical protein n=1 Tax=Mesorhizobium sp. M0340 TaxID=2956939 RepID=UPI003336A094
MSESERLSVGAHGLPISLAEVLAGIESDGCGVRCFGGLFWRAYHAARLNDISDAEKAGEGYVERLSLAI